MYYYIKRFTYNEHYTIITVNSNKVITGYQLLDLTGKVLMQGKLENAEINVSDVAAGIYNLQLVSKSNESLMQRIVIK